MSENRSRKTVRHFQCRDDLWVLYEKMATEFECSVDYLINEAMRQYARSRRSVSIPPVRDSIPPPSRPSGPPAPGPGAPLPRPAGGGFAPPPSGQRLAPPPGQMQRPGSQPGSLASPPRPQAQPPARPKSPPLMESQAPATTQPMPTMDTDPMAQRQAYQQRPQQAPQPVAPAAHVPTAAGTMPTLYLVFNGQKIPVTKEQFIIGRGLKTSDLAIKDGNISRKHAAIIYHNGSYYIKDLGSINGIEYGGKRIDSKRIEEADVYHICDYELRFTYQ